MHPDYLLDKLTSEQLSEWEAYDSIDPIGKWRDEFMIAYLCAIVTNITNAVYSKKGQKLKTTTPLDFLPDWSGSRQPQTEKKQSVDEMKSFLLSFAAKHNKKLQKNEKK